MFDNNFFINKKVVITGCTGFRVLVNNMARFIRSKLYGLALEPPTSPSIFEEAKLDSIIDNNITDIKDTDKVKTLIKKLILTIYFI